MTFRKLENSDERNAGFGAPLRVVDHKPGFEVAQPEQHVDDGKDHRRRPKDAKEIPQTPLAKRIRRATRGGK
jgi:hypothetical protein